MASTSIKNLQGALDDGLGIVTRIWEYKARNWVTSICTADVDGDGDIEIIAGSRDGRVYCLSKTGRLHWKRDIGTRAWIGTIVVSSLAVPWEKASVRIVVGTRDGKVYILDKDGSLLTKDGSLLLFNEEGKALDLEQSLQAYWFKVEYVIRSVYVDPLLQSQIIVGSEDRCAYGLDYKTGRPLWKYQTGGWVRAVFSCDINADGNDEILIGSVDGNLYVLDLQGRLLNTSFIQYPIRTIFAADVDQDGSVEILVTTNHKNLVALAYYDGQFVEKWERGPFENRLLALCVADIDNDGRMEIIAGSEDKHTYIFDATGKTIWRSNHNNRIFSIATCDVDNDGIPELLIGAEHKRVRAMRVRLRRGVEERIRGYYRRLGRPDTSTIVGLTLDERRLLVDTLGLGTRELVTFEQANEQMDEGVYDKALSTLLKLERLKVERLWRKNAIGYIRTVCFLHTANESRREIIVGTNDGGIYAFYAHGRRAWFTQLSDHIVDVQTGFIDLHKKEEIVVCASNHYLYMLEGAKKQHQPESHTIDTLMSSICIRTSSGQNSPEIIIGSEDKTLSIYGNDLQEPLATIPTKEGVRIVRAHTPTEENIPDIVIASLGKRIYAYKRNGTRLWSYEAYDRICSICIKDIDGDGQAEILVGSEDRNIHVLDSRGHLLWRYYLPHSALTVDAADADQDGMVEVFVGCADGNFYVFSYAGDLLWTYQARDRIHAVGIEDIDSDGNVEIAIGAEDEFELLRVVNQQKIHTAINQCWAGLQQKSSTNEAIELMLNSYDPFLQAFALNKLVEQGDLHARAFDLFEGYATTGASVVRKELARLVAILYQSNPPRARSLLRQLSTDSDLEVRDATIEHLPALMEYDWEEGFYYLKRAAENTSRFVRRIVVRKVHEVINTSAESSVDRRHKIFGLLLTSAQDKDSEWVRQEAAHTLAHFLDQQQGGLIVYIHLFIIKGIQRNIWEQIAYATTNTVVRRYINAVIPMLFDFNENNVQERLQQMVQALGPAANLPYGKDLHLLYAELYHLFTLETLQDIANYQSELDTGQFNPNNQFARNILPIFEEFSTLSRPLKMYFRREGLQDRLTSLLEAINAVDCMPEYLEQHYSALLLGEPMSKLPDHQVLLLLLKKWKGLMQAQLSELRGKAELAVQLQTRDVRKEEQVGIWLAVKNNGRSSANDVKVTLLHDDHFEVVGSQSFETEVIPPEEETWAEFILKPCDALLNLKFEIVYGDADNKTKMEEFVDSLELRESYQEFRPIPNPYSTGTPTHDSRMFFGREDAMAFLQDHLTREAKSVIVLYGQRRSGKTTLLLQLIHRLALDKHIPVLVDLQRLSYHMTIQSFLYKMAYYISQAMKKKNMLVCQQEEASFEKDPTHAFDLFLDCIEEHLGDGKLILMIDEFEVLEEQVARGKLESEIFDYLRDIVEHRQNINFLFSGTHKITEFTRWYRSVFFNIARHYRLSRLTALGAENLIQKPVEGYLEYEPLTVKKVRQLTADQPYLIHLMCRAIVDYCNERQKNYVTINDVNIVLREVMQTGRYHFDWLWDQIKPEERVALAIVTECSQEEGRWLPLSEIEETYRRYRIPYKNDYLIDTLKTLIDADIIESEQDDIRKSRFRIAVGLTRGWMLKEHPLQLVRQEMNG